MIKAKKRSAISIPRACNGVVLPKSLSNIPKQPQLLNLSMPWLIAHILLAIKPAISGRLSTAAIRGYIPKTKANPRTTSTQGRISVMKKAMVGVQKEPKRSETNSSCPGNVPISDNPGSLPMPATSSISPSNMQGAIIINVLRRLLFNCGFRMPIELSSPVLSFIKRLIPHLRLERQFDGFSPHPISPFYHLE